MRPIVVKLTDTIDYSQFIEPLITPPPAGWTPQVHQPSGVRELVATLQSVNAHVGTTGRNR